MALGAKEDATSDTQQRLELLCDGFRFPEVISALAEPDTGGGLAKPIAQLLRGRALAGLTQFHSAYGLFTEVRRERDISALQRVEAQLRSARVLRHASPLVDFALQLATAAADNGARLGDRGKTMAIDAHVEAALLFARKRCKTLAEAQIDKARTLGVLAGRIEAGLADVALAFDDRPRAKRAFEAAAGSDDPVATRLGRLGLARLCTLLGEFDEAEAQIRALQPFAPLDIGALRVQHGLLSARGRWKETADVLEQITRATPEGDSTRWYLNQRASALFRAGEADRARQAWEEVAGGEDHAAKVARRMLEKTKNADAPAKRLTAFPSVSQLRDHCGPASVELCLRFFGISANQVEVAREIKHPDGGTPVYRMRKYMEQAGFVARRVEADLPKLKAILDAGVPVIVEEDYSTSRHVAVAVGYDDRRELLEVQDPMTHELRETLYEELAKLREFSNHGALLAVPKDRQDLLAKLDALGADECAYMTKTDEAWKALDDERFEDGDKLADEAIALHEPYELAWVYRFTRARGRYVQERSDENKQRLISVLNEILELWPDDEWPQQFLGRVYDLDDRFDDALAAFERARDRDPDDANNYCSVGDCLRSLGRSADAQRAFEQALERDPGHVRSNENLADLAFESGDTSLAEILNACALELHATNPFNHHVRGRILAHKADPAGAAAAYDKALEHAPGRPYYVVQRARHWASAGRADDALGSLRELSEKHAEDSWVLTQWADLAYEQGRTDESLEACARIEKLNPENPAAHAISGAARCKAGELEPGLAVMKKALALSPTYAWVYREMGRHLAAAKRHDEAIMAYAANAGVGPGARATFLLGRALAGGGYTEKGVDYFKRVADSGELTDSELLEVARGMRRVSGAGTAHGYFQNLAEQRLRDPAVLIAHAHFLVEDMWAPGAAATTLAKLSELEPEHPFVVAKEGDDLMDASLELEPKGEELLRKAIARAPKLIYPRRSLVRQFNARGRFQEALTLLEPAPLDEETAEDRVKALLGLEREADARAAAAAYAATLPEETRGAGERPLLFELALAGRRYDEALAIAEAISSESGESPDDGELSRWEKRRFECLVALGRSEEAYAFGEAQCADAEDRGDLAYYALKYDDYALSLRFAEAALELDPNETSALHVMAKHAEMEGDVARAVKVWERMQELTGWHIHVENIARVSVGLGNLERARGEADKAVATGHVCPVALQVRAEIRLVAGDRDGAKADADRALACTQLEWRSRSEDTRGLLLGLSGDKGQARRLYDAFLARERLSLNSRARLSKVMEALAL